MSGQAKSAANVEQMEEDEEQPVPAVAATDDVIVMDSDAQMDNDVGFEIEVEGVKVKVTVDKEPVCTCVLPCPIHKKRLLQRNIKSRRPVGPVPSQYGSLNYPDGPSDEEDNTRFYFEDDPKLYQKLMAWRPGKPAPISLKIWRNMLNDEYASGVNQTPLNIFYRKFLNRQLGNAAYKIVRTEAQSTEEAPDDELPGPSQRRNETSN